MARILTKAISTVFTFNQMNNSPWRVRICADGLLDESRKSERGRFMGLTQKPAQIRTTSQWTTQKTETHWYNPNETIKVLKPFKVSRERIVLVGLLTEEIHPRTHYKRNIIPNETGILSIRYFGEKLSGSDSRSQAFNLMNN